MLQLCRNCSSLSEFESLFNPTLSIQRCLLCGGWNYSGALPPSLEECYSESYFKGAEYLSYQASLDIQKINFRRKLEILERKIPNLKSSRWLEIGSATAAFFDVLQERYVISPDAYVGIEISEYARTIAADRGVLLLPPEHPRLLSEVNRLKPNIIVLWDTWEHLENPVALLKRFLADSAHPMHVAITTLDASSIVPRIRKNKWRQFHPPTHLNYPTRRSFEILFNLLNGTILVQRAFGYYRPLSEYVAIFGNLGRQIALNVPLVQRIPLYCNLFDTQFIVARI